MLGTGTQTDPYQVTTIDEMVEAFNSTSSDDLYIKLMNDLDFNESEYYDCPTDLFKHVTGHKIYFNGNGHTITNLYNFQKRQIFYNNKNLPIYIYNLTLEAVVISMTSETHLFFGGDNAGGYSYFHFQNCDFRVKYYNYFNTINAGLFVDCVFLNCIMNIDIIIGNVSSSMYTIETLYKLKNVSGTEYPNYYNEWNINIILNSAESENRNLYLFSRTYDYFSSFFIQLNSKVANKSWPIEFGNNTLYNCYIVAKNVNDTYTVPIRLGCYVNSGISFYDKDVIDSSLITNAAGERLLGLTTEQCKDANYLEDKGFIIAK